MQERKQREISQRVARPAERRRRSVNLGDVRRESAGEWLFNHRVGLLIVVFALLVGGAVLATVRYSVEIRPVEYTIEFVEETPSLDEIEELRRERDRIQEDIERRLASMQHVQNLQSNEASEVAGSVDQMQFDSDMQEMMERVASDMADNRGDYESGLRNIEGRGTGGSGGGSGGTTGEGDRGRFSGAVTVSYNFDNPVRNHRDLYVPAYRSYSGGVVVVDVWIDRNGAVTAARIASSTNPELNEQALAAARHSRTLFRIESTAPASHRGTITYTFVAQSR